jgi:hypothetical protein
VCVNPILLSQVSRDQFLRVLQKEGLLIAAPKVVSAVVRKFAGGSNDRTARVDYRAFVAHVDPKSGGCGVWGVGLGDVGVGAWW